MKKLWEKKEEDRDRDLDRLYDKALAICDAIEIDGLEIESLVKAKMPGTRHPGPILEEQKKEAWYRFLFIYYVMDFEEDINGNALYWDSFPPAIRKWRIDARLCVEKRLRKYAHLLR